MGNFDDSFLEFIAFRAPSGTPDLSCFGLGRKCTSFKLRCLEATSTEQSYIEVWGGGYHIRQVKIQYDSYHLNHVEAVRELRDLLYRARSLKKLVLRLKEGNLQWETGEEAVSTLADEILIEKPKYPRLS